MLVYQRVVCPLFSNRRHSATVPTVAATWLGHAHHAAVQFQGHEAGGGAGEVGDHLGGLNGTDIDGIIKWT